ncbi:GNAT family N-acetyltransferase [Sessilibacter sp. MAH2]
MEIDCEKAKLNVLLIHQFLSEESQWAKGISLSTVQKSLENSLCFGGYVGSEQIAFARVITDYSTFANLVDVFVLPNYRGNGFGKKLMEAVISHPELQGLRRFTLATADAHGLYSQCGFASLVKPQTFMERYQPDVYVSS